MSTKPTSGAAARPTITVAKGALSATLFMPAGRSATPHELRELVKLNAICVGLQGTALAEAQHEAEEDRHILIASGKPPEHGSDGRVEYLLSSEAAFRTREDGSVDFWEAARIKDVVRDQELARYHPATLGRDGIDVHGRKVEAHPGSDRDFESLCGAGTRLASDDKRLMLATRDGVFHRQNDGVVTIQEQVTVPGAVDLRVGNIDTQHAVLVQGDVMAGFAVRSAGVVRIDGVIEDARVSTRGDLIVAGGILAGAHRIKAHGEVHARFIHERTVKAGSVHVTSTLRHATVLATGDVHAGSIQGGRVVCGGSVVCENLGSPRGDKTLITIGIDPYQQALREAEAIAAARAAAEAAGADPDKVEVELPEPPPPPSGISITVTGALNPPVEIRVGPQHKWKVSVPAHNVVLRLAGDRIVALPGVSGANAGDSAA